MPWTSSVENRIASPGGSALTAATGRQDPASGTRDCVARGLTVACWMRSAAPPTTTAPAAPRAPAPPPLDLAALGTELEAQPLQEGGVRQVTAQPRRSEPDCNLDGLELLRGCPEAPGPLAGQEAVHESIDAVVFVAHSPNFGLAWSRLLITSNYVSGYLY